MSKDIFAPRVPREILCSRNLRIQGQPSPEAWNAEIIIGICLHNQAASIPVALASALAQTVVMEGRAVIVLLDDSSADDWRSAIRGYLGYAMWS